MVISSWCRRRSRPGHAVLYCILPICEEHPSCVSWRRARAHGVFGRRHICHVAEPRIGEAPLEATASSRRAMVCSSSYDVMAEFVLVPPLLEGQPRLWSLVSEFQEVSVVSLDDGLLKLELPGTVSWGDGLGPFQLPADQTGALAGFVRVGRYVVSRGGPVATPKVVIHGAWRFPADDRDLRCRVVREKCGFAHRWAL